MVRLDAGDTGILGQPYYQPEVAVPQSVTESIDAHWKAQIQKCNQTDAQKNTLDVTQVTASIPGNHAPESEQKQQNTEGPIKADSIANKFQNQIGSFYLDGLPRNQPPKQEDRDNTGPKSTDDEKNQIDPIDKIPNEKTRNEADKKNTPDSITNWIQNLKGRLCLNLQPKNQTGQPNNMNEKEPLSTDKEKNLIDPIDKNSDQKPKKESEKNMPDSIAGTNVRPFTYLKSDYLYPPPKFRDEPSNRMKQK